MPEDRGQFCPSQRMPIHDDASEGHQKVEVRWSDGSAPTSEIGTSPTPRLVFPLPSSRVSTQSVQGRSADRRRESC